MNQRFNHIHSISCWWVGALLCASLSACSSDTTIHDVEEQHDDVPMQFSQAAINSPATRADGTSHNLEQGFLVSCWKAFGKAKQQVVMDKYEVKYKQDLWNNSSRWDYVGTKSTSTDGYYQDQYQRYWDASAYAYRFYAITPCPPHDEINSFTLTDKQLVIPETVSFVSQTCENGKCTTGAEPYSVAQVECPDGSNNNDIDLLANGVINKSNDGHTTTLTRYVALPFHHITSKVRFGIYSSNGTSFKLSNIKITAQSDGGFITAANGYTANLSTANMLSEQFTKTTAQLSEYVLLTDGSGTNEFSKYNASSNPYWFQCENGLLQIPQQKVKLLLSFDINDTPYSDIPIAVKSGETTIDSFTWESNKIYTYYINISDLKPLTIEFSAELAPWTEVTGSISTDLEK
ncbi:fimbrillin family protein [Xylanibacter ruminicola]|nr:fimbrillin family protein [Xylanibacter ruminicola]